MRWTIAPLMMVIGILAMKYTVQISRVTGPLDFAEKYFSGAGGTYAWWRLVGFVIMLIGLLWLTGIIHYTPNSTFDISGGAPE
jgi:hypothetical protein